MERLSGAEERLDGPLDDRAALVGNLRDLRRVNRLLGGVALSARALDLLADGRSELTLLDVGTGGADIPVALIRAWRRDGRRLEVVGLDSQPAVLAAAVVADPRLPAIDGLELHVGDGRALPYPDGSFDVAHVSLVVHHLEPDGAVALLREIAARRAARASSSTTCGRGRLALLGAWVLAHVLTDNPFTRHDAPMSVRRAYTPRRDVGPAGRRRVARDRSAAWAVRAPLGDRRGPDRRVGAEGPMTPAAHPADVRVDVAIVGGGPAGAVLAARSGRGRHRGRRAGTNASLALASERRVRLAGGRRRPATGGAR